MREKVVIEGIGLEILESRTGLGTRGDILGGGFCVPCWRGADYEKVENIDKKAWNKAHPFAAG